MSHAHYTREELGQVAYNAYGVSRNWLAYDGRPIPRWEEMGEPIREAWREAGMACALVGYNINENCDLCLR